MVSVWPRKVATDAEFEAIGLRSIGLQFDREAHHPRRLLPAGGCIHVQAPLDRSDRAHDATKLVLVPVRPQTRAPLIHIERCTTSGRLCDVADIRLDTASVRQRQSTGCRQNLVRTQMPLILAISG